MSSKEAQVITADELIQGAAPKRLASSESADTEQPGTADDEKGGRGSLSKPVNSCRKLMEEASERRKKDGSSIDLLPFLKLQEFTRGGKVRPLYTGSVASRTQPKESQGVNNSEESEESEDAKKPRAEYTADLHSKLAVDIDDGIALCVRGEMGIRARILRPTPVELPVDNYTVVDRNELRQEQPSMLPDYFLRESDQREVDRLIIWIQTKVDEIQERTQRIQEFFPAGAPSIPEEIDKGKIKDLDFVAGRYMQEIGRFRELVRAHNGAYQQLIGDIQRLLDQIDKAYGSEDILSGIPDEKFERVSDELAELRRQLEGWRSQVIVYSEDVGQAPLCDTVSVVDDAGYRRKQECFVKVINNARFAVKEQAEQMLPYVSEMAKKPNKDSFARLMRRRLKVLRNFVIESYEEVFRRRLSPAEIHLAAAPDLKHGEMIEITVRIRVRDLEPKGGGVTRSQNSTHDFVHRFRIRAVEEGVSLHVSPQFTLIKRFSDVSTPSETEIPSNYTPAPGVVLAMKIRTRREWLDWVIPSPGLLASAVHFDPRRPFELGLGASLGLANDLVHVGVGRNLMVEKHYLYWFVSIDFAQTFGVFDSFFTAAKTTGSAAGGSQ